LLVTTNDSFHPDVGGDKFFRNIGELHGVTSQRTAFFIDTVVETSNLTKC
jgi:hypothetical protein